MEAASCLSEGSAVGRSAVCVFRNTTAESREAFFVDVTVPSENTVAHASRPIGCLVIRSTSTPEVV